MAMTTADDQDAWNSFKFQYHKHYKTAAEEQKRMEIFLENLNETIEHNKQYDDGKSSYKKGINEFSDMTHDEFHRQMSGYGSSNDDDDDGNSDDDDDSNSDDDWQMHKISHNDRIPDSVDWREKGKFFANMMHN